MNDLISRQVAIDICTSAIDLWSGQLGEGALVAVRDKIAELPSAEEESFEWCTDCKEYDQEKHCCHKWTKVIRNTVEELRVVKCKDCIYGDYKGELKSIWCSEGGQGKTVAPYDFCSYAERREVTT